MSTLFANNLSGSQGGNQASSGSHVRRFNKTDICVAMHTGLKDQYKTDVLHLNHLLCHITDLSAFTVTRENERDITHSGKDTLQIDDGVLFEGTLTIEANALGALQAILGRLSQNTSGTGVDIDASLESGKDYGTIGADMFLYAFDEENKLVTSGVILDFEIALLNVPGSASGGTTREVRIRSRKRFIEVTKGFALTPFIFLDDGANITNSAAPDGVEVNFAIKDANHAFSSVPGYDLMIMTLDPDAGNPEKYILGARIDGAEVDSSDYSVNQANATLTFTTAPADGVALYGIAAFPSGFPSFSTDNNYYVNQVVLYDVDGNYYRCTTNHAAGAWNASNFTVITSQTFPVPYWHNAGTNYQSSLNRAHPLWSWDQVNAIS